MQNTKIFSALAALALAITPALAAEYLPDVENVAAEVVDTGVKLTWDAVANANQYTVYFGTESISTDGASYENSLLIGNVAEYVVGDLEPATEYFFAVAADDSTGEYLGSLNYSEEVSATTPAAGIAVDPLADLFVDDSTGAAATDDPADKPADGPAAGDENSAGDPLAELFGGELSAAAPEESSTPPENLPKSGPAAAVAFLLSGGGAYFWRKFRK